MRRQQRYLAMTMLDKSGRVGIPQGAFSSGFAGIHLALPPVFGMRYKIGRTGRLSRPMRRLLKVIVNPRSFHKHVCARLDLMTISTVIAALVIGLNQIS